MKKITYNGNSILTNFIRSQYDSFGLLASKHKVY